MWKLVSNLWHTLYLCNFIHGCRLLCVFAHMCVQLLVIAVSVFVYSSVHKYLDSDTILKGCTVAHI